MVSAEGRTSLPLFPNNESPCGSCTGACCREGTYITMTAAEYYFMTSHGARLAETPYASVSPNGLGNVKEYYQLVNDCPFLAEAVGGTAVCSIYEDPRKPASCSEFEAGSEECLKIREEQDSGC